MSDYTEQEPYPRFKYNKKRESVIVESEEEEELLHEAFPGEWKESLADFGVETAPGLLKSDNPNDKSLAKLLAKKNK